MNKDKTDGLTVDAVIPTFQPEKRLIGILECLEKQTLPVRCVRIINSGRDGFRLFLEEAHLTEQQFLENYPFRLERIDPYICDALKGKTTAGGYIQLLPGVHESDGFFIARLRRLKED